MQNELYKKTIQRLQEEIKKLKAEPAQAELEALREELKSAKKQIAELKAGADGTGSGEPAKPPLPAVTAKDLHEAGLAWLKMVHRKPPATEAEKQLFMTTLNTNLKARTVKFTGSVQNVLVRSGFFLVLLNSFDPKRHTFSKPDGPTPVGKVTVIYRTTSEKAQRLKHGETITVAFTVTEVGIDKGQQRGEYNGYLMYVEGSMDPQEKQKSDTTPAQKQKDDPNGKSGTVTLFCVTARRGESSIRACHESPEWSSAACARSRSADRGSGREGR
jgi:hypothetical protein